MGRGRRHQGTTRRGLISLSEEGAGRERRPTFEPEANDTRWRRLAQAAGVLDGLESGIPVAADQQQLEALLSQGAQVILCYSAEAGNLARPNFIVSREMRGLILVCGGKGYLRLDGPTPDQTVPREERVECRLYGDVRAEAYGQIRLDLRQWAQTTVSYGAEATLRDEARARLSGSAGGGRIVAHDRSRVELHDGVVHADGCATVIIPRFHKARGSVFLAENAVLEVPHRRQRGPKPAYRVPDLGRPVELRREQTQWREHGYGTIKLKNVAVLTAQRWPRD